MDTALFTICGMKLIQGGSEVVAVEVGVYLRCGDALMSEHFLDGTKVCPAFYKVRGKRMPQCVW